jgi:threonine dehydratase
MTLDEKGRKVPDYLKMILMCEYDVRMMMLRADLVAKVYSKPLSLQETPLTYAANLSARFGNEVGPDDGTRGPS